MSVHAQLAIFVIKLEIGFQGGSEHPDRQSKEQKANQEDASRSMEERIRRFENRLLFIVNLTAGWDLIGDVFCHLIGITPDTMHVLP
jgi:hypothetical protein